MSRTALFTSIAVLVGFPPLPGGVATAADQVVTVDGARLQPAVAFMQGFLHGFQPDDSLDATRVGVHLRPNFWRLGFGDGWSKYRRVAPFKPRVTMVISDLLADTTGGHSNAQPWRNWAEWERFCSAQVTRSMNEGKPVAYWDIWSEPDTEANWTGSWSQLLETYQRCYTAIKRVDPDARVVGPGTTEYDHPFDSDDSKRLFDFVLELSREPYNVRLEVVSWHELGSLPSSMPGHAQTLRDAFSNPAYFDPPYMPELHVNEYSQPNNTQIPGWLVAWLYYAEQADLDFFSRACWPMWESASRSFSNCMVSLQGVFMRDLVTPQQPYYVYRTYAAIAANTRIVTTSTDVEINALASRNDASSTVKVMVGMHDGTASSSVDVDFVNFPYGTDSVDVTVSRLVNNNVVNDLGEPKAQPAIPPYTSFAGRVAMTGGRFTVSIQPFADGEMYVVEARAAAKVTAETSNGRRSGQ